MQIAFYDSQFGTLTDKLIAWKTAMPGIWSPFSHVEAVLEPIYLPTACQPPRKYAWECVSSSPRDDGVRKTLIDLNDGHWYIIDWPAAAATSPQSLRFVADQLGKPYDWLGVFGFVCNNPSWLDERRHWFCSEFVTAFLQSQGLLTGLAPARISPQSLFRTLLGMPGATCYAPGGGIVDLDWFKAAAQLDADN